MLLTGTCITFLKICRLTTSNPTACLSKQPIYLSVLTNNEDTERWNTVSNFELYVVVVVKREYICGERKKTTIKQNVKQLTPFTQ